MKEKLEKDHKVVVYDPKFNYDKITDTYDGILLMRTNYLALYDFEKEDIRYPDGSKKSFIQLDRIKNKNMIKKSDPSQYNVQGLGMFGSPANGIFGD